MNPLKARISLSAYRHNLKAIQKIVGPNVHILPVIKANAYGHGVLPLARESLKQGVPMLGLGTLEEGLELRRAKIAAPILLLDGIFKQQAKSAVKYHLTPVVTALDTAKELNRLGSRENRKVSVHLKFDTGMNRLGFTLNEAENALEEISSMKNIFVEGIMTHMASSSDASSPQNELQLRRFEAVLSLAKDAGLNPTWIHAANSGAIINFKESHYSMVRPGISLYGYPNAKVKKAAFKVVMTLTTKLISVKSVNAGEGIGYDATYITPRRKRVGVVFGGYEDGVNRLLSNRGSALVRGVLAPIVGNVCMDNFMIDLSRAASARVGDEVTLLGPQHAAISAEKWAELCGTISYEILTGIGNRVERVAK
ncbi:MAG: alanine racemase [Nitrospinota bacterium]